MDEQEHDRARASAAVDPMDHPDFRCPVARNLERRVQQQQEQLETLPSARSQEEFDEQQILVAQLRSDRERLHRAQLEAREACRAFGWPEDRWPDVTSKSLVELDAERDAKCAENRKINEFLTRQPKRVQRRFRGRRFAQIKGDPHFRVILAASTRGGATQSLRTGERRPVATSTKRRRAGSSSRTSSADPGEPDGEPEPPRLAELVGRPLANFVELHSHLTGPERLEKFGAQPLAVQTVSYVALREAIERRRAA